jgi:SAM-dependent methyltransferase
MSDWTAGYVADIGYTFGYYPELNPLRVKLAFLNAGLVPPEMGAACELGFGQGMSANMHAASSVVQWSGTDFNPSQAAFAQELASSCGSGAQLFDEGFDAFCTRSDLPEFDYIGLHGIWSWISDENRAVIVDFIRRKLKVGGVVYISYNTQPGWAAMVPMRDLLTEHAEVLGSDGAGIVSRIDSALAFVDQSLAVLDVGIKVIGRDLCDLIDRSPCTGQLVCILDEARVHLANRNEFTDRRAVIAVTHLGAEVLELVVVQYSAGFIHNAACLQGSAGGFFNPALELGNIVRALVFDKTLVVLNGSLHTELGVRVDHSNCRLSLLARFGARGH